MSPLDTRTRVAGAVLRLQPDSRLAALAREGHEAVFEEIVRRYRGPLVGFAAGIVPRDRAEDVVQDALAKAIRALRASDAEVALRPWLYTIVRNTALNDLRDQPRHAELDETIDGVPQPPDIAAEREEFASLVARLQALPEEQRAAIVQRELEGRSHQEIATSIGSTPAAVRGLIFRARTSLRHAAGFLIPLPLVRYLLDASNASAAASASAAAGGAMLASGGGAGGAVALKAGVAVVVGSLALGSGVALRENRDAKPESTPARAEAADADPIAAEGFGGAGSGPAGESAGEDDSSGPGSGEDGRDDSSGPGSGDDDGPEDSSGPGSGGDDDRSGSGGGSGGDDDDFEAKVGDSSGSGSGGEDRSGSDSSGSGSDSSGSGSSGSGSDSSGSGSDSSGSGSGDEDEPEDDD